MKRTNLNFTIDAISFIAFIFLTTTGILMYYILPAGSGKYLTIWGLDRHQWGTIHFWVSIVFFSILTIHLILHWRWIANVVRGKSDSDSSYRIGLGFVGIFALIAISILPLLTPVQITEKQNRHIEISGSMTLLEIEKTTGIKTEYVIKKMNLPTSTSVEKKLSDLKAHHEFKISDIKKIINEHHDNE